MRRRAALMGALLACSAGGARSAAPSPRPLLVEWRWVHALTPLGEGLHSAGSARGRHTWSNQAATGVEPLGTAVRVLSGSTAEWSLGPAPGEAAAPTAAWVLRDGRWGAVQVPLAAAGAPEQSSAWQVQVRPDWAGGAQPVRLRLAWAGPGGERIATTLDAMPGRWAVVAQRSEGAGPAPEPGVLRSTAAIPLRTRELQVRVTALLE